MTTLKYGDSLEGYGRNKGGRYLHKIRGGKFVQGVPNHALCWADVTKPATRDDYHREICGECRDRPEPGPWSEEDRTRFERVSVLNDVSHAQRTLRQALRTLPGGRYPAQATIARHLEGALERLMRAEEMLNDPEAR